MQSSFCHQEVTNRGGNFSPACQTPNCRMPAQPRHVTHLVKCLKEQNVLKKKGLILCNSDGCAGEGFASLNFECHNMQFVF